MGQSIYEWSLLQNHAGQESEVGRPIVDAVEQGKNPGVFYLGFFRWLSWLPYPKSFSLLWCHPQEYQMANAGNMVRLQHLFTFHTSIPQMITVHRRPVH